MREQHSRSDVVNILPSMPVEFTSGDIVRALDWGYHSSVGVVSGHLRKLQKEGKLTLLRRGDRNQCIWTIAAAGMRAAEVRE